MYNFLGQSQPGNHFTVSIAAKSARNSVTKLLQPTQAFLYVVPPKIWPLLSPPLPFFLLSVQRGPNNGGNGLFAPARKRWFLGSCCTRRHRFLIQKRFLSLSSSIISPRHASAYVLTLLIARNYPNQLHWECPYSEQCHEFYGEQC